MVYAHTPHTGCYTAAHHIPVPFTAFGSPSPYTFSRFWFYYALHGPTTTIRTLSLTVTPATHIHSTTTTCLPCCLPLRRFSLAFTRLVRAGLLPRTTLHLPRTTPTTAYTLPALHCGSAVILSRVPLPFTTCLPAYAVFCPYPPTLAPYCTATFTLPGYGVRATHALLRLPLFFPTVLPLRITPRLPHTRTAPAVSRSPLPVYLPGWFSYCPLLAWITPTYHVPRCTTATYYTTTLLVHAGLPCCLLRFCYIPTVSSVYYPACTTHHTRSQFYHDMLYHADKYTFLDSALLVVHYVPTWLRVGLHYSPLRTHTVPVTFALPFTFCRLNVPFVRLLPRLFTPAARSV